MIYNACRIVTLWQKQEVALKVDNELLMSYRRATHPQQ